jgi:hypothetical protein
MEDQINGAFWQSQINIEYLYEFVGGPRRPLQRNSWQDVKEEHPLESRKPARIVLLKGNQARASAGACL